MIDAITASDDVQFYWLIVTADFDDDDEEEVKSALLSMIIELYLTMRGFSFASNWVEKFKQSAKKAPKNLKVSEENCIVKTKIFCFITNKWHVFNNKSMYFRCS